MLTHTAHRGASFAELVGAKRERRLDVRATRLRRDELNISAPPGLARTAPSAAPPRLLTVDEVRAELKIGRTLAYQLVWSGAIPVGRIGHALRVRRTDLEAYVEVNLSCRVLR